ncbi:MAG: hypothetical protein ACTS8H_01660 [Arsenophonus sp. NC-PE1-MAG3]
MIFIKVDKTFSLTFLKKRDHISHRKLENMIKIENKRKEQIVVLITSDRQELCNNKTLEELNAEHFSYFIETIIDKSSALV